MSAIFCRIVLACLLPCCAAMAQETLPDSPEPLAGTLKKIKESGLITLGHRENSVPFAFPGPGGRPIGYSLDLCAAVVEAVTDELGEAELRVELRPVTPENRFALLVSGEIDLECGSSTNNSERRKQVAFSPVIFVTGTRLLVRKGGAIESFRDLAGRRVVVTQGTTNAAAMQTLSDKRRLAIDFISGRDHDESFAIFDSGRADAFASDDVLLHAWIAETRSSGKHEVVGEHISYDPYGLALRKDDPQFAAIVDRAFHRLAESGEILWIYETWFTRRLPSGVRLNLAMSPQLQEIFRSLGLPAE